MDRETTVAEAKKLLDDLLNEKQVIEKKLAEADRLKQRLRELNGGWSSHGEIKIAELRLRDVAFPIYETDRYNTKRVVALDNKWIYLRTDGGEQIKKYKKGTGWPERSRDGNGKIDSQKAIAIWEACNG